MHWHRATHHYASRGKPWVMVTVLATSGSAPRPAGTKMVVAEDREHDTIGGGQLEHLVIAKARELLRAQLGAQHIEHFPLAAAALQCCGGSVTVLFECFTQPSLKAAVFGAGHIGQRCVSLLEDIGANISWFDAADRSAEGDLSTDRCTVRCNSLADPVSALATLPADSHIIIVTHDHQLDYLLLSAALRLNLQTTGSIGMIGSLTKWQRFKARLLADGIASEATEQIRCPLGKSTATDKQPAAIAIAIVAELLEIAGAREKPAVAQDLTWSQIKSSLVQHEQNERQTQ